MELASELNLTQSQIYSTKKIIEFVRNKAVYIGKIIVEKERLFDQLFSSGTANEESLQNLVNEIAKYKGELRFIHLNAHRKLKKILTPEQISLYDKLRGYITK